MRDNKEGGSRDPGSARQQPAEVTATAAVAAGDEAGLRPVSADMQQFIGRQLRAVFDDVAKQPIPDRFLELMKQLDNKTEAR